MIRIVWGPLPGVRGGIESSGKRFVLRPSALGGMELLDRREGKKYRAGRADPLRRKAEEVLAAESGANS